MRKSLISEKLLLENVSKSAQALDSTLKGLSVAELIKLVRTQLKMSQEILAKRANLPQSTISRIEQNRMEPTLSTLQKIFEALSCDFVVAPILKASIDVILNRQAQRLAEQHVNYLKGTMSLEKQEPDKRLIEELIEKEKKELLHDTGTKLWKE